MYSSSEPEFLVSHRTCLKLFEMNALVVALLEAGLPSKALCGLPKTEKGGVITSSALRLIGLIALDSEEAPARVGQSPSTG